MKKRILGSLIGACLLATTVQAEAVTLVVDGQVVETRVEPINEAGTVLVPLREAGEALDAWVEYIPETRQIVVLKGYTQMVLELDVAQAYVNGEMIPIGAAPKIVDDVALVPIRLISEQLDCTIGWDQATQTASIESKNAPHLLPIATLSIEGLGEIKAELYPGTAPITVENFTRLANEGFYDGLTFHRVIEDFMIQGGCPLGNGTGGPGYTITGEFISNNYVNMLLHTEGVLSMARSSDPDSAGSQFFIVTEESPHLNADYAAFGKVIEGMEVVEAIEAMPTDATDQPLDAVIITSIRVQ